MLTQILLTACLAVSFAVPSNDEWEWMSDESLLHRQDVEAMAAVEAEAGGQEVTRGDIVAIPSSPGSGGIVIVVERAENAPGAPDIFTGFRIARGGLVARTNPLFRAPVPPDRREFAREVAERAAVSTIPEPPVMSDGHMFVPTREGLCRINVVEKDRQRTYSVHTFNVCH